MVAIARFPGSHEMCPRYQFIMTAVFEEVREADIPPGLLERPEFKNATVIAAHWSSKQKPSEFCLAPWRLFGPDGVSRRQMLEANRPRSLWQRQLAAAR